MSEDEFDNSELELFWAVIIFLYLLGTAIYNFGWLAVVLAAIAIVAVPSLTILLVSTYLQSEWRNYRIARRDIRRIIKWGRLKINQVSGR